MVGNGPRTLISPVGRTGQTRRLTLPPLPSPPLPSRAILCIVMLYQRPGGRAERKRWARAPEKKNPPHSGGASGLSRSARTHAILPFLFRSLVMVVVVVMMAVLVARLGGRAGG